MSVSRPKPPNWLSSFALCDDELGTLIVLWVVTLLLWSHFVVTAICEPDISSDGVCSYYYRNESKDDSSSGVGGYSRSVLPFVVLVFLYFMTFWLSVAPVRWYLQNVSQLPSSMIRSYLVSVRPVCWLSVESYRDSCFTNKMVKTWGRKQFHFTSYRSNCEVEGELPEAASAMRLRLTTGLDFADDRTKVAFHEQMRSLVREVYSAGPHFSEVGEIDIPGLQGRHILFLSDPSQRPFWCSSAFYNLCLVLTLGAVYHTFLYCFVGVVDVSVTCELGLVQNNDENEKVNAPDEQISMCVDF